MMKLTLSDLEHHQLETAFKTTSDPRLHHRCQAILMAARGGRHNHIAEDLAVSPRTVQRWLNAYQAGRLEGLHIRWAPGRPPQGDRILSCSGEYRQQVVLVEAT